MQLTQKKVFQRWSLTLVATLVLSACGGGGDSESPNSSPQTGGKTSLGFDSPGSGASEGSNPVAAVPVTDRIVEALTHGSSAALLEDDKKPLLQSATQIIQSTRVQQKALVAQLIDDSTAAPLNFSNDSQTVSPLLSTSSTPLLVSDGGYKLASISTAHGGRGLGYGKDLLGQLSSASGSNQAQLPLFKRSFTWLATGNAQGSLPATIRVSSRGYNIGTVNNLVARLGSKTEVINCTIDDPANTCWQNVDVFVFGQNTPASSTLSDLIAKYMQAGKGVIYLHSNWGESAGGSQVLQGMGMQLGGYAGNWFAPGNGFQIGSGRTAALQRESADLLGSHETVLLALLNGTNTDFAKDSSLINKLDGIRNDLLAQESRGINLFSDSYLQKPYLDAHRRLVLWADLIRQQVDYSKVRRSNPDEFLRTMAADTLSYAVRGKENTPKSFGDWMPAASPNLATS